MQRELIRCSEGYWNLIDEFGKLICRFKIDDRVKVARVIPTDALQNYDQYSFGKPHETQVEERRGTLHEITFVGYGIFLDVVGKRRYIYPVDIQSILRMEVVK